VAARLVGELDQRPRRARWRDPRTDLGLLPLTNVVAHDIQYYAGRCPAGSSSIASCDQAVDRLAPLTIAESLGDLVPAKAKHEVSQAPAVQARSMALRRAGAACRRL
jgi:hypothetical protein